MTSNSFLLPSFEMLSEIQRDLTPETAAQRLRECAEVHFLDAPVEHAAPSIDLPTKETAAAA